MKRLCQKLLKAMLVMILCTPSVFANQYANDVESKETLLEAEVYVDQLIKEDMKNEPNMAVGSYGIGFPIIQISNPVASKNINQRLNQLAKSRLNFLNNSQVDLYLLYGRIQYANTKYLSIVTTEFYTVTGAAHALTNVYGMVFDEKTGKEIPRSYFLPIQSMDDIYRGLTMGHLQLKNMNGQLLKYDPFFKAHTLSNSYYIDENNHIFLIFQQYELAPYSDGTTVIEFSPKQILNYRTTGEF